MGSAIQEINAQYAEIDAALPERIKQKRPILSWEEIKQRYPDTWVAVQPIEFNVRVHVIKGRVFAHARNRQTLKQKKKVFEQQYSGLILNLEFTGQRGPLDWAIA